MTELGELAIQILVHRIESFLEICFGQFADWVVCRVVVDIWKEDGLRKWRSNVLPRAAVTVATSTNLRRGKGSVYIEGNIRDLNALCSKTNS